MIWLLAFIIGVFVLFSLTKPAFKSYLLSFLVVITVVFTSRLAIYVLASGNTLRVQSGSLDLLMDSLSSVFILMINFTVLSQLIFSFGYLKGYAENKTSLKTTLHYFNIFLVHISMLLVVCMRNATGFLICWELLSLSTFVLVLFDGENEKIRRSAINYFFQMHLGLFLILTGFFMSGSTTSVGFDALHIYFSMHKAWPVYLLFFIGFGLKAGFLGLHTWLPDAHPSAPSHISALMSGIIIKMGIYGILRVTMSLPDQSLYIGIAVLLFSSLTGLYGVMQAIVQHDIKRLLAFHSIENIGIIGMGIGVGIMGRSLDYDPLSYLGFGGAILHTVNHSLFKSLLFYGAGVVVKATHTHNIEKMGGLIRKMPRTAILFLVASLAICGLPPFNGFVSEFLIYSGLFRSLQDQSMLITVSSLLAIISLALIGGFAIFCFTKVFGIVFLGSPRSENAAEAGGKNVMMEIGQALPALLIVVIGLIPAWFVRPVNICVQKSFSLGDSGIPSLDLMQNITTGSLIFVLAIALLTGLRYLLLRKRQVKTGPTWGCGYDALTVRHQYTATSYAQEYQKLYGPMLGFQPHRYKIPGVEIFPGARSFVSHTPEKLAKVFSGFFIRTVCMARKMAVLQTGHVRHYALYLLLYLMLLLLLTFFNVL